MTVALDFDGVIHRYSKGWNGGDIYDPPMDGSIEAVKTIMAKESVFVFTARAIQPVCVALEEWGLRCIADNTTTPRRFWNKRGILLVTNRKLPARLYLDDRAVPFSPFGGWDQAMRDLGFKKRLPSVEDKIRDLHYETTDGECGHCNDFLGRDYTSGVEYPCPTIRALD